MVSSSHGGSELGRDGLGRAQIAGDGAEIHVFQTGFDALTYRELYHQVCRFANGLKDEEVRLCGFSPAAAPA
jgi:hypothetical protein